MKTPPEEVADTERSAGSEVAAAPASFLSSFSTDSTRSAILVTVLAFATALAVGALVIVFSDPTVLHTWSYFTARPSDALSASWHEVYNTYSALLAGSIGSPKEMVLALTSGSAPRITQAFYPLSETIVAATPLIFTGLAVSLAFRAGHGTCRS
jgi:simple sugar transport system permease protein